MSITEQINEVVDAREKAREATTRRVEAFSAWQETNSQLYENERIAKEACLEAEAKLRELALASYEETGEKKVAPGVGIRVMTRLDYDTQEAMTWAVEHKLALKLDTATFEKIAKTSNLSFVTINEESQATIATELVKVKEEG